VLHDQSFQFLMQPKHKYYQEKDYFNKKNIF